MKEFITPSTMTMVCNLRGTISLPRAFTTLPVVLFFSREGVPIKFESEGKKKNGSPVKLRTKICYYGTENILVSARFEGKSRGMRSGGKTLINTIAVDFQCCGKNIHIKVSENKFTLTGIKNEEMGHYASEMLCSIFNMIQMNQDYVKKSDYASSLEWIYENAYIENDHLNIPEIPDFCDSKIVNFFSVYLQEYGSLDTYRSHVKNLINFNDICTELEPFNYNLSTAAYIHTIESDKELQMINLCMFLRKNEIHASYSNWEPNIIPVTVPFNETMEHTITICKEKTIKQNSPHNYEEAYRVYCLVMGCIEKFLDL